MPTPRPTLHNSIKELDSLIRWTTKIAQAYPDYATPLNEATAKYRLHKQRLHFQLDKRYAVQDTPLLD
jgi:hypothetical protein